MRRLHFQLEFLECLLPELGSPFRIAQALQVHLARIGHAFRCRRRGRGVGRTWLPLPPATASETDREIRYRALFSSQARNLPWAGSASKSWMLLIMDRIVSCTTSSASSSRRPAFMATP